MVELAARTLVDWGLPRGRAVALVAGGGFLVGLPSARSLDVLGNQDFVWGVALMISGAFIAWLVYRHGSARLCDETASEADWRLPRVWHPLVRWVIPLQARTLLNLVGLAGHYAGVPRRGRPLVRPFNPYSLMTSLVQWAAVLAALVLLNGSMSRRLRPRGNDIPPNTAAAPGRDAAR